MQYVIQKFTYLKEVKSNSSVNKATLRKRKRKTIYVKVYKLSDKHSRH